MNSLGVMAALSTAVFWAGSAVFSTSVSRRIGAFASNNWRVFMGTVLVLIAHMFVLRRPFPIVHNNDVIILVLSGIIGIAIGDTFLHKAFIDIGPRLALLVFSVNPFVTALIAWPFLGEKLKFVAWVGIFVTLSGTIWVLNEENKGKDEQRSPHYIRGILFALLSSISQSVGFIIAKPAMLGVYGLNPLSATLVRLVAATITLWSMSLIGGKTVEFIRHLKDSRTLAYMLGSAVCGPSVGICLSLLALKLIPAGIAATLIATMPIVILPFVILIYKERISWKAVVGAMIAVIGVAILINA